MNNYILLSSTTELIQVQTLSHQTSPWSSPEWNLLPLHAIYPNTCAQYPQLFLLNTKVRRHEATSLPCAEYNSDIVSPFSEIVHTIFCCYESLFSLCNSQTFMLASTTSIPPPLLTILDLSD